MPIHSKWPAKIFVATFYIIAYNLGVMSLSGQEAHLKLTQDLQDCPAVKNKVSPAVEGFNRVNMTFEPIQVISVNELNQAVTLSSLITFEWFLLGCQWNSSEYNDIDSIDVDTSIMWTPVITNPKSMDDVYVAITNTASVTSEGKVTAMTPSKVVVACYLDLERYPFDSQNCTIPFISVAKIDVYPQVMSPRSFFLENYFSTSAEWLLIDHSCTFKKPPTLHTAYTECSIYMKRRSAFYIATLVFPIGLMSVMTLLVFCIPPDSGEKMSFVISIFVSMNVYINFVVDVIPRSMDRFPRILQLIVMVIIKIAMTTAATAFVLKKYHRKNRHIFSDECPACRESRKAAKEKHLNCEVEKFKQDLKEGVGEVESAVLEKGNGDHRGKMSGKILNKVDSEVSSSRLRPTESIHGDKKPPSPGWRGRILCLDLDMKFFILFLLADIVVYVVVLS